MSLNLKQPGISWHQYNIQMWTAGIETETF